MSEVSSTRSLPIGTTAPDFALPDAAGTIHALSGILGPKGVVLAFLCNHCPFVIHLAHQIGHFAKSCRDQGVGFAAINANDAARYPADSPDKMPAMARASGWDFPYLCDESQAVARAYCAACTPDFYLFDVEMRLVYCGQFDDSRPGNQKPVTGHDLRRAVEAMLGGQPPVSPQRLSSGCNIKWKPGNEPPWFRV